MALARQAAAQRPDDLRQMLAQPDMSRIGVCADARLRAVVDGLIVRTTRVSGKVKCRLAVPKQQAEMAISLSKFMQRIIIMNLT
ncbi:MAG: hypothetical protein J0H42_17610 [Rhizobiales bacterium]|nr:hypothetical protein [Hyphomicrobiales bacterium]